MTSIEGAAFAYCSNLTSITVPSSVTSIGSYAFRNCSSLAIYCEIASEPSGWNSNWNSSNRPVVWEYKLQHIEKIDVPYDATVSSLDLPTVVTIDNVELEVGWDISTYVKNQIGEQILLGTFNDEEYNYEYDLKIKVNTLPFTLSKDYSTKEYTITKYYGTDSSVVIPSTYRGEKISIIGKSAFEGYSSVTSIELTSTIKKIEFNALRFGTLITNVYYDGTIEDWCNIIFDSYYSNPMEVAKHFYMKDSGNEYKEVTEIIIPKTVTEIGEYQFLGFENITNITFEEGIKLNSIDGYAFRECKSLISIVIPEGVKSIGGDAFDQCSSLTSVTLPKSLISIGDYAFDSSYNITKVYYGGTIETWCNIVYKGYALNDAHFSSNPMYRGSSFYMLDENKEYYEVTEIVIPNSITSIGINCFYGFKNVTSVTFEEGSQLTSIGSGAFSGCSNLTSIIIPSSVTSIGSDAFSGCSNLTIYCEAESVPSGWSTYWNSSDCPAVWGYKEDN